MTLASDSTVAHLYIIQTPYARVNKYLHPFIPSASKLKIAIVCISSCLHLQNFQRGVTFFYWWLFAGVNVKRWLHFDNLLKTMGISRFCFQFVRFNDFVICPFRTYGWWVSWWRNAGTTMLQPGWQPYASRRLLLTLGLMMTSNAEQPMSVKRQKCSSISASPHDLHVMDGAYIYKYIYNIEKVLGVNAFKGEWVYGFGLQQCWYICLAGEGIKPWLNKSKTEELEKYLWECV